MCLVGPASLVICSPPSPGPHLPAFASSSPTSVRRISMAASSLYAFDPNRSGSVALQRANSIDFCCWPSLPRVSRSPSVPDVTGYYRPFDRKRPAWLSEPYKRPARLQIQRPFRRERNKQMAELYWRDRYYFFSPLYKRDNFSRRPFDSEYGTHIYSYWARYNGYSYDRQQPGFDRRYFYPIEDYFG